MYDQKDYVNFKTEVDIDEKGFSVYNYISLGELISTVNKDYLESLNLLNIPFAILTIVIGYVSYETGFYEYLLILFTAMYGLTFIYLIVRLIHRTYKFSLVTNIIYTKKGLVLGNEIHHYKDDTKLNKLLWDYQELFDEYLSRPSKLSQKVQILKENLTNRVKNNYDVALRLSDEVDGKLAIASLVLLSIYTISIFIFYYLGLLLGFILFFILISFIKLYFFINKSTELRIKNKVTKIDKEIEDLNKIYLDLNSKIEEFKDGEISDLSKKVENEFNSFYKKINDVLIQKDKLKIIIENSIYKDFIDFPHFALYVKNHFNKPLEKMIHLLEDYEKKIILQIQEVSKSLENIDSKEKYQVEVKLINLQTIKKNLDLHLNQLRASLQ